jgi:hypothetical protein
MRLTLTLLLTLTLKLGLAQKINVDYRTVIEDNQSIHYLIFTDKTNCILRFPPRGHGDAMLKRTSDYTLKYKVNGDTLTLEFNNAESDNSIIDRLTRAKFIVKSDKSLYDIASGFVYIDKKKVSDKYTIYSIDGQIYKQKTTKTDGYGLVKKSYKPSGQLKKKLESLDKEKNSNYTMQILKGKQAYDKYGLLGMNGVFEIEVKK